MEQTTDFVELPNEVTSEVNDVSVDVTVSSGSRDFLLESPYKWEVRISDPILQVHGAEMVNRSQLSFHDHAFGESNGGGFAVVMEDRVGDFGFQDRVHHRFRFAKGVADRFFAPNGFACLSGGNGNLSV